MLNFKQIFCRHKDLIHIYEDLGFKYLMAYIYRHAICKHCNKLIKGLGYDVKGDKLIIENNWRQHVKSIRSVT